MNYLAHPEDCGIERNLENMPGFAVMMDCDGEQIFSVPDSWTDEQMFIVLNIVNNAFSRGTSFGELKKAQEIKTMLGIFT